ncbi:ROK family transcriptional regulator [Clostridium estertheticum]|uniref:ROK family transcriptional regulator n=1 Tax=Clostridium estertheticum TaxID=238834 RepID=UPI001CF0F1E5|nr:ROK family transcriptional regulator [Clostridium estertheticum]MCB2307910.1 ROK family transcriptional regulator [Clostridium estertheticum]MCB2346034.1 ROK family transcriptional regulator [Clostridium estertheticum]MCB2351292.1 ROK family transcriptional regulator [Clostridium estertheticum]WAG44180.1 ROK family transcriptional regulator [Clostridium estertheticum]
MKKFKILDQETIKQINKKNIIQLLYKKSQITKHEIAKELHISIPTVISNVNELIEEGYLDEAGVAESTGGRKPIIVRFLPDARYSFGVCITPSKIRIALINLKLQIIKEEEFKLSGDIESIDIIMEKIKQCIDELVGSFNIPKDKIIGVGFSLPGTVNEEELLLVNAPNLKLNNIDFKKYEKLYDYKFFIENEANAAAYAETFLNLDKVIKNLVFVSITEGIGAGVIINDNLYKGNNKRAGEFGHMTIVKDGELCNCGKKGCFELYASEKALINKYNEEFNVEDKNLKEFFRLTKTDEKAKEILYSYIDYLAEGIKNIILITDPEEIIIGGKIAYYEEYFKELLMKKVFEKNSFYTKEECRLSFSKLKENASILGAALMTMQEIFFTSKKII